MAVVTQKRLILLHTNIVSANRKFKHVSEMSLEKVHNCKCPSNFPWVASQHPTDLLCCVSGRYPLILLLISQGIFEKWSGNVRESQRIIFLKSFVILPLHLTLNLIFSTFHQIFFTLIILACFWCQ